MTNEPTTGDQRETLELIVAYLDGELSSAESTQVEKRLASEEAFRKQLQSVERTWSALDELPQETVGDRFSQTTLEMVATAAQQEVQAKTTALPIERRRRRVSTWLAAAAVAGLAFALFRLAQDNPNRQLQANLPVVMNVDAYTQIPNLEFLQLLAAEPELLAKATVESEPQIAAEASQRAKLEDASMRKRWLASLPDEERTKLRYQASRFQTLSADEQARMRKLHAAVVEKGLEPTVLRFQQWLGSLPEWQQYDLRQIEDVRARAAKVAAWIQEEREEAAFQLNEAQLRAVSKAMRGPWDELRKKLEREMREKARRNRSGDRHDRGKPPLDRQAMARELLKRQLEAGQSPIRESYQAILAALPSEVREPFEQLPPERRWEQIKLWARQAAALEGEASEQELERFFVEELSAEQRETLLSLPPEEMQRRLRQFYDRETDVGFNARSWDRRGDRQRRDRDHDSRPRRRDLGPPRDREGLGREDFRGDGFGPPREHGPPPGPPHGPPPRD